MRILVPGGKGLVGSLVRRAAESAHAVHAPGREELDITDEDALRRAFTDLSPDVVINCAAFTDVDGAEREPEAARAVNALGASNVALAAKAVNAAVVHVSTDYVFDGRANVPYREQDATAPLSSYGRSKLEGERRVLAAHPEGSTVVRAAWIYGPGKGFVDWARARLERDEELPLIEDQTGSPTSAAELAAALVLLAEGGHRGLFHFVNAGSTTWLELGRHLAREIGVARPRIRPIRAEALSRPAARPAYSVLAVDRFESATGRRVSSWREALARYLAG